MNIKILFLVLTFLLPLVSCSNETTEEHWEKISENEKASQYVDFGTLREVDEYLHYSEITDFRVRDEVAGFLSYKFHIKADCRMFRFKVLETVFYEQAMGRGVPLGRLPATGQHAEWQQAPPNSVNKDVLNAVCSR